MARSISFTIDGDVETLVKITESEDGTLRFDLSVLGSGMIGDLRGLFFDMKDYIADDELSVSDAPGYEDTITAQDFDEASVDRVDRDANVRGEVAKTAGRFDGGVGFGTSGMGKDDIQQTSFILSSDAGPLSLDTFDLTDIAARFTSVGVEGGVRDDSSKILDMTSGVARNDAFTVLENSDGTEDLLANDTNGTQADGNRKTVISVTDQNGTLTDTGDGFERVVVIGGLELGTLVVSYDGFASFEANGADVDKLGHDALETWNFTYETVSTAGDLATADVTLSIDGVNDQPVAEDLFFTIDEDDGFVPEGQSNSQSVQNAKVGSQYQVLTGDGITGAFLASDIDIGDTLSFEILGAPTDAFGNEYGEVTNNGDGTFTFNPTDEFQFLNAGESRDVTFQYVARDDSGVGTGPTPPEESDTSDPKTVTITVTGLDDADIGFSDSLLFETFNQSMFGTGEALIFQPDLPFFGFETDNPLSLSATIVPSYTFAGDVLGGILDGIEAVGQALADLGCSIVNVFGGDCDADVDVPDSITTPSIRTQGAFDAKVGLQPYFSFNSGEVDASVPVDVVFTAPRQVENGDTITVNSLYSIDGGASFQTMSPNVNFGLDFVFDLDTNLDLLVGSSRTSIFNIDTGNIDGFEGELGEPGFNIFDADGSDLSLEEIDLFGFGSLDLGFPVINTTGTQTADPEVLESSGEDDVAVLSVDVDAVIAQLIEVATGVPVTFGETVSDGLGVSVAGVDLNLIGYEVTWDLVAIDLINTFKAVQDFTLTIDELPLMAMLEDGSVINGFSLGDDITISTPTTDIWDADIDGDADGLIGVDIAVDMEALFENDSWLGFDMDLFTGLLRLNAEITSDFFDGPSVQLFDGLIPSVDGNNDGFLLGNTFSLLEDVRLATLYNEEFDLEGWNQEQTEIVYDIA